MNNFILNKQYPTFAPTANGGGDTYAQNQDYTDHGFFLVSPFTFVLLAAIAILSCIRIYQEIREYLYRNSPEQSDSDNTNARVKSTLVLTLADHIALYNKTFESNQNHMILAAENIVQGSIDIDIESCRSTENKHPENNDPDLDGNTNADQPSVHLRIEATACRQIPHGSNEETVQVIPGTCIICLEDFGAGDCIVWSESYPTHCKHVYHKECMVNYLANNAQRKARSRVNDDSAAENPCPTCRREFCTVHDKGIVPNDISKPSSSGRLEGQQSDPISMDPAETGAVTSVSTPNS